MPTTIHVPEPAADHPSWIKVGVIAAIGFAIGIAWPRLAGIRLGPNAPEMASAAAQTEAPSASASASFPVPPPPPPPASVAVAAGAAPTVTVGHGFVLSCKSAEGETLKAAGCGPFASFEAVAQPRLKKLEKCAAADGVSGKLAVVFSIDFDGNHIGVDLGKATTIPQPEPLVACVKSAFQGAAIGGLEHTFARYTILYTMTLVAPAGSAAAASAAPSGSPAAAANGEDVAGQVMWETALVRDTPRSGQITARLPRGTKVEIGAGKDNWYKIKYGPDMATEGYVYRGAIGK